MKAAEARGKHLGRPATPPRVVSEIEALAADLEREERPNSGPADPDADPHELLARGRGRPPRHLAGRSRNCTGCDLQR